MFNLIIQVGNLTKDPELKFLPTGTAVCSFNLAVNSRYGDKKEVLFIAVTVFGKQAEACSKYLVKGSPALVEGRLTEQRWEKDGEPRSKMVIIANNVRFLGSKDKQNKETEPPEEHSELEPF